VSPSSIVSKALNTSTLSLYSLQVKVSLTTHSFFLLHRHYRKELKEGNRFQASPRSGGATSPRGARSPRGRGKDQAPDKLGDSSDGHGPRERRLFPLFSACDKDDEALAALRRELIR
jgi:hypothetical protein